MYIRPFHRLVNLGFAWYWVIIRNLNDIDATPVHRFRHRTTNLLQPHRMALVFTVKVLDKGRHLYYVRFFSISSLALGSVMVVHLGRQISEMRWSLSELYILQNMVLYSTSSFVSGVL